MTRDDSSFYLRIKVAVDTWFSLFNASIKNRTGLQLIHAKLNKKI